MIEYLVILFISVLPWIELRGSIPIGILVYGLDPLLVFALAVTANILVFFPIHFMLTHSYSRLRKYGFVERTVQRIRDKVGRRGKKRYDMVGLATFVAIPLPVTGAWTGTLISWLVDMEREKAFASIAVGVIVAGIAVTLLSVLASEILVLLGVSL